MEAEFREIAVILNLMRRICHGKLVVCVELTFCSIASLACGFRLQWFLYHSGFNGIIGKSVHSECLLSL